MKAVIYARYSSDNQREESIEGQIRECAAFAEKNGITILRHYIDRAFSAKTDNRPEFQNMIKDSGKRLFDMVIVWKLDRFARNRYDSARYKATLKKNGVKVVSATEVISDGAEGIILESVLEGYAEYYSADLSEKVVRGMTENALKSKYNGGTSHTGNTRRYYKCVSVKKKRTNCHKKSVKKDWIEDLVVSETMKMVMDDKTIDTIVAMLMDLQNQENVNLPLYEQQLREADRGIQNLLKETLIKEYESQLYSHN